MEPRIDPNCDKDGTPIKLPTKETPPTEEWVRETAPVKDALQTTDRDAVLAFFERYLDCGREITFGLEARTGPIYDINVLENTDECGDDDPDDDTDD
jgi:hypothetical protein